MGPVLYLIGCTDIKFSYYGSSVLEYACILNVVIWCNAFWGCIWLWHSSKLVAYYVLLMNWSCTLCTMMLRYVLVHTSCSEMCHIVAIKTCWCMVLCLDKWMYYIIKQIPVSVTSICCLLVSVCFWWQKLYVYSVYLHNILSWIRMLYHILEKTCIVAKQVS